MGAFGVALEVSNRLAMGLLQPARFNLAELVERGGSLRQALYLRGRQEKCDRGWI